MDRARRTSLVEKFNKKEEHRSETERSWVFVCNGGGNSGCGKKSGDYCTNNKAYFKTHISKFHQSNSAALKEEGLAEKFNKSEEERDEIERGWIYVCKDCSYMGDDRRNFQNHITTQHSRSDEQ